MPRPVVPFVLSVIGLLLLASPARAAEIKIIAPATVVAQVGTVFLTAGQVLVPHGSGLDDWWQGAGNDIATQKTVHERLEQHLPTAIQAELLQEMLHSVQARGGPQKAEKLQPLLEHNIPVMKAALRKHHQVDQWAPQLPASASYIEEWLTTSVEADLMANILCQSWYRAPARAAEVRTYWEEHREDFSVVRSAKWHQLTISSTGGTARKINQLLDAGATVKELAAKYSNDAYRLQDGLVTSQYPHVLITPTIIHTIQSASIGKTVRVNSEGQIIYLQVEQVEQSPGEFFEVARQVQHQLARARREEIVKTILASNKAAVRVAERPGTSR